MADQPTRNEEQAIQEQNEINQGTTTTITARVPYHLKARLYDLSERSKINLSAYVATRLYRYVQGEIVEADQVPDRSEEVEQLQKQLESESSLHKQAVQDAEKYRKERDRLQKKLNEHGQRPTQNQLDKVKQEKDQLSKQVTDLQKQLKQAETDKDKRIKQLEKELDQQKSKLKEKESARKSEANKREEYEQRIKEANEWAERTPFIEKRF